jgi:hypothetical protein
MPAGRTAPASTMAASSPGAKERYRTSAVPSARRTAPSGSTRRTTTPWDRAPAAPTAPAPGPQARRPWARGRGSRRRRSPPLPRGRPRASRRPRCLRRREARRNRHHEEVAPALCPLGRLDHLHQDEAVAQLGEDAHPVGAVEDQVTVPVGRDYDGVALLPFSLHAVAQGGRGASRRGPRAGSGTPAPPGAGRLARGSNVEAAGGPGSRRLPRGGPR